MNQAFVFTPHRRSSMVSFRIYNPHQFLLGRLENKSGIAIFITYVCLRLCVSFPSPPPCLLLDSSRRIMCKDTVKNSTLIQGEGREVKARQKLAISPRVLPMIEVRESGCLSPQYIRQFLLLSVQMKHKLCNNNSDNK